MIPYSWDGNTTLNDDINYSAWLAQPVIGLPEVDINIANRFGRHPLVAGIQRKGLDLLMEVEVRAGSADTLRAWFDPEDEVPKVLVITNDDGTNARYWRAICYSLAPTNSPYIFLAKLRVDGDVRLRSVAPTTSAWTVTASGQTTTVTNGVAGVNDDAYPVLTVTPRAANTSVNPYRRHVVVKWRSSQPASNYPLDIVGALDTRPANTNFDSATGNDIRIYVDGVAQDYWLTDINTTGTSIWLAMNWLPMQQATTTAATGTGALATLTVAENIDDWPLSGTFAIGLEVFQYTGKVSATKTFTGITRAKYGTTATNAAAGSTLIWIQHDIVIEYGAPGLPAWVRTTPTPMLDIAASTNTNWVYSDFAESMDEIVHPLGPMRPRPGSWVFTAANSATAAYPTSQNGGVSLSLFEVLGIQSSVQTTTKTALSGEWTLTNPCGIELASLTGGYFFHGKYTQGWWKAVVRSAAGGAWTVNSTLSSGTNSTWTSWSRTTGSLPANTNQLQLQLQGFGSSTYLMCVELGAASVTLPSATTPLSIIGAEETTYRLRPTITNQTTGESIAVDAPLAVDQSIEIDVGNSQVTLLADGMAANHLVSTVEGVRRWLLRLQPGSNVLRYDEAGVTDVDVDISFERRWRS